ncbi:phytanoyl-CoA dioxygenase family protein [Marinivivus vitaminiproducens]|uniref:phytanoyl-CoA dioxygenase family protein n=1 Tax=Marinivivus vitaminiproducens TaxID=3035935 RepID=UPI0027A35782|nr:phytanoyl-CoA dioxygenase family protein [Geminicoccaceae bacterium SCSIO 64248]
MLTPDQIAFYRENGYILVEDAIDGAMLDRLRALTYGLIDRSRSVSDSDDVFDLDEGHSAESPKLTRIKNPVQRDPAFLEVLRTEKVRGVLEDLIGPSVRLQTSKLNTKAPGGGAAVEWHQDWAFYPHTNDDMLAIGLMLEDVDEANGPLMVLPGSHKGPVLSHFSGGVFCGAVDPADPLFDHDRVVTLTGKAGSMTLHHVRTLHGSAPNLSDRARLICFYELSAADAWPLAGGASAYVGMTQAQVWEQTNQRLVFGEQTARPRLKDVPVLLPLPPAPDSSSIFKIQKSGRATSAFAPTTREPAAAG